MLFEISTDGLHSSENENLVHIFTIHILEFSTEISKSEILTSR